MFKKQILRIRFVFIFDYMVISIVFASLFIFPLLSQLTSSNALAQCFTTPMVAAGGGHIISLKSDGTVVAVGNNIDGECNISSWTGITQVAAGARHTLGIKSDGTVVAVGLNDNGQCNVSSWTDITQIAAGYYHTVGVKSDGTMVAVGSNDWGQCNVSSWTGIRYVAAGGIYTVGIKSDGTMVTTAGFDVSSWTDIIQIASGSAHAGGLKSDGTVVAVGDNSCGQCNVSSWTDIIQVAAGGVYTVGLKSDGTVVAVGPETIVSQWNLGALPNTPVGSNVTVYLPSAIVTFSYVSGACTTSCSSQQGNPGDGIPEGFRVRGLFVDITTTATYTPPVTVGLYYDPSEPNPQNLKLFHWEGGQWVDVTRSYDPVDTVNHIVYGEVNSLSWFFIGGPLGGGGGGDGAAGVPVFPSIYIGIGAALGAGVVAYVLRRRLIKQVSQ